MTSKYKQFKQGNFYPRNIEKCLNDKNDVVYRSKLELEYMMIFDSNTNVVKWASEKVIIPYFNTGKNRMARYFVDFFIETVDGKRFLIEVKPFKESEVIRDPSLLAKRMAKSKAKKNTLLVEAFNSQQNREKWKAAQEWCDEKTKKGFTIKFLVLTEKDLEKTKKNHI